MAQRPYGRQGYAPGVTPGRYTLSGLVASNPEDEVKPFDLMNPNAPRTPVARAATPVATAAPAISIGPGPMPATPQGPRPFDQVMAKAAALAPTTTPYAGPPRPYGTLPATVRTWEGGGPLEVSIPRPESSLKPDEAAFLRAEQAGRGEGAPQEPLAGWQRINAPGMRPLLTPEQARPYAAPQPVNLMAQAEAPAGGGMVVGAGQPAFTARDRLLGIQALKGYYGSSKDAMAVMDAAERGDPRAAEQVREARNLMDEATRKKEQAGQVTIPGTPGRVVEGPMGGVQVGGVPERTIPKSQLPLERLNYTGHLKSAELDMSAANNEVTRVQKLYDEGGASQEELDAAKARLQQARDQFKAVLATGLSGTATRPGQPAQPVAPQAPASTPEGGLQREAGRATLRMGKAAPKDMATRLVELLYGKLMPDGRPDPTNLPMVPGADIYATSSENKTREPNYGRLDSETLDRARITLASEFGPGRTKKGTQEDALLLATRAVVVWASQNRFRNKQYREVIDKWAKKNPTAWQAFGMATDDNVPSREPTKTAPSPLSGGAGGSLYGDWGVPPGGYPAQAPPATGGALPPAIPPEGQVMNVAEGKLEPARPAEQVKPGENMPAPPQNGQRPLPKAPDIKTALQMRSQQALNDIKPSATKFPGFGTFLDAVDVDPKTERFDLRAQEKNGGRQAAHPLRQAYDMFTRQTAVPPAEANLPLFDSTYGRSVWSKMSTDQQVALVRVVRRMNAMDVLTKPRSAPEVQALLSMFAQQ